MVFNKIKEVIDNSSSIYVVGHENPDGDSIGSAFGICLALKSIGKNAKVIMPSYSDTFSFLPHIKEAVKNVMEDEYDLLIAVDSSEKVRLAISDEDYNKAKKVVMFDHHKESNNKYGDYRYVDSTKPAASQIIFDFLEFCNIDVTREIATYLYTGIMTDTGSFNYSSTQPSTFVIASKLVQTGIDFSGICQRINHTIKEAKLKLIACAIDNMEVYYDGKLRYTYIDYSVISSLGLNDEESEGMTNYLLMPEGTEVSIYVRQRSDGTNKVSMRSRGKVDVSKIAISCGGGGHARAAGYTMVDEYNIEKDKVINVVGVMLSDDSTN